MQKFDEYSYHCGVMDAFNEVVHAGVKKLALSHPLPSKEDALQFTDFIQILCDKYETFAILEEDLLLTDLFPISHNRGMYVYLFYKEPSTYQHYMQLKQQKQDLIKQKKYHGEARKELALAWGALLSYDQESCLQMIAKNTEKEENIL